MSSDASKNKKEEEIQRKRASFLQKKINPYDPSKIHSVEEAMMALQECSFQGRNLGIGLEVLTNMVNKPKCLRVLCLSGAMIPAGMEELICQAIERKVIGAIVSTGANITHSIVNSADEENHQAHYVGSEKVKDDELYKLQINRIYDTYLPESAYYNSRMFLMKYIKEKYKPGEKYVIAPSEFLAWLGSKLPGRSFIGTAAKYNIPIYCGATSDSELGMDFALYAKFDNIHIIPNEIADIHNFADYVKKFETWGTIILGGGVPRNWAQQIFPYLYITQEKDERDYPGYEFSVRFHAATQEDGGLSGCTISEGVSWGKYQKNAKNVSVWGESTVYFPLIMTALFQRMDRLKIKL